MDLKGKTFILTGARRIGKNVAHYLGETGANLAITYLTSKEDAEFVCEDCQRTGSRAIAIQTDLALEEDIKKVVSQTIASFGRIDGLIHMASPYPQTPLGAITLETFNKTMNAIAASSLLLGQAVAQEFEKNAGETVLIDGKEAGRIKGKIIYFSDWSINRKPYPDYSVYNAAKSAVNSITFSLARALAPNVTVNAIAPGPIIPPPDMSEEDIKKASQNTLLKRWGGSEEIAKAVSYLLNADFVTGVILPVDGGRSID